MSFGFVGRIFSGVKGFYNEINSATLNGAIDVIIVQQQDGTYLCSPFHVRFGKMGVLRSRAKVVDIEINGKSVDLQMKLGEAGEAFFVQEVTETTETIPEYLATSPISSSADLMEQGVGEMKLHVEAQQSDEVKVQEWQKSSVQASISEENETDPTVNSKYSMLLKDLKSDSSHDELSVKGKPRRKVLTKKKQKTGKSSPRIHISVGQDGNEQEIFEMEVSDSSEEEHELTNLPKSKSISLPLPDDREPKVQHWRNSATFEAFLHPLSEPEPEPSPLVSPVSSRPPSPKSDTEVDHQRVEDSQRSLLMDDSATWEWGSFPTQSSSENLEELANSGLKGSATAVSHDVNKSSGVLSSRKTSKPGSEGIYLDDLQLDDPEISRLYLGTPKGFRSIKEREDDSESGRGPSLPQSPHSVEGAVGGPSVSFLESEVKHLGRVSLSLCGGLSDPDGVNLDKFMQSVVTFEDLSENPSMISNPDLVVKILDSYYNWMTAAPMVLSQVVFHRDLPEGTAKRLIKENMPKKEKKKSGVSSWFSWRRTATEDTTASLATVPTTSTPAATAPAATAPAVSALDTETDLPKPSETTIAVSPPSSVPSSVTSTPRKNKAKSPERVKDGHTSSDADTDHSEKESTSPNNTESLRSEIKSDEEEVHRPDHYKKALRLTTEQIVKLNLHEGQNEISYSVTTQYQGTTRCTSHIYLWKYDDKIVISDIDGTITKSDVLGQILPILGRDWSQSGVAQLFTSFHKNGYKLLYLSARAIGQAKLTKELLRGIKQGKLILPEGPLLLNPTSLVNAFHREVITKNPEEFKISCLKDIAELFPQTPFYAGFGNKINDVWAYRALKIPNFRIFTINHKGELRHELSHTFQSSYKKMSDVVDHFFPPVERKPGMLANEYSAVNYWRDPLPDIVNLTPQLVDETKKKDESISSKTKT